MDPATAERLSQIDQEIQNIDTDGRKPWLLFTFQLSLSLWSLREHHFL